MRGTVDEDDMLLHVAHQKAATEKEQKHPATISRKTGDW